MFSAHNMECHLVDALNAREEEILPLWAEGLSNREIAGQLILGYTTVKWYSQQIYDKLGLEKPYRKQRWAVYCARQLGLLATEGDEDTFLVAGDNPYKGLDAFNQEDANLFFGREAFVAQLIDRLRDNSGQNRFLALVGPSGSGKSSVVRAGLIPALQQNSIPGSSRWAIVTMFPKVNPFFELEVALHGVAVKHQPNLLEMLQRDAYGLARVASLVLPEDQPLLIIIDQFEELFTLVEDSTQVRRFMDLIYAAVTDPRSSVRVVITLRADFLDRPLMYPDFSWLIDQHIALVCPLTPNEMAHAIVQPAQNANVTIESGVIAKMLADANEQPGALPHLQFTLTELYDSRIGSVITMNTYEEVGGLRQTLATQAEKIYDTLTADQQEIARQLFLRLITLGEGSEDMRRRVPLPDLSSMEVLSEALDYVIQFLTANRLLTVDLDLTTKTPTVEVAHEALIREWVRLCGWLDESRNDVRMERLLALATNEWNRHERDASFLMRGAQLSQFRGWQEVTSIVLTTVERDFLEESVVEHERQQRRRRTLRNIILATVSLVAVIMGILAFTANNERNRAESAEYDALFQSGVLLAAQSQSELENGYTDLAVLLALEALENYPYSPQAEHALGQAVSYNRAVQQYIGHSRAITSVAWSPDGTKIATSSTDNTVHVWDAVTGDSLQVIEQPEGITGNCWDWALTVTWSPDGNSLVTVNGDRFLLGSQEYDIILWDAATGEEQRVIEIANEAEPEVGDICTSAEHFVTGQLAAFAPTGDLLATVGGDNTAIIWTPDLQTQIAVLRGHDNDVNGIVWSPDGAYLTTFSEDGTMRLWETDTGQEIRIFEGHEGSVNVVSWSSDGTQLVSGGDDGIVYLWDIETGDKIGELNLDVGTVWSLAWTQDDAHLMIGTDDGILRLWNIVSQKTVAVMRGHSDFVSHLVRSPIDDRIASASADSTIRTWNANPTTALLRLPYGYASSVDWSSNSQHIIYATGDFWGVSEMGELAVWSVTDKQQVSLLGENLNFAYWLFGEYSPDGRYILANGSEISLLDGFGTLNDLHLFDITTGEIIRTFTISGGDFAFSRSHDWSPHGTMFASGTGDGFVHIFDIDSGELLSSVACSNWVNAVAWSPNGSYITLVCGQMGEAYVEILDVSDPTNPRRVHTLPDTSSSGFQSVAWSPDGSQILTTGGDDEVGTTVNPVQIWDVETGDRLISIEQHTGQVWWGTWSPDGNRIATGSTDGTTQIWDVHTGASLLTLLTPNNWSVVPEWSPNGHYLAVATAAIGEATPQEIWRVWQSTDDLIKYAYNCCVFRELTSDERDQFGLLPR